MSRKQLVTGMSGLLVLVGVVLVAPAWWWRLALAVWTQAHRWWLPGGLIVVGLAGWFFARRQPLKPASVACEPVGPSSRTVIFVFGVLAVAAGVLALAVFVSIANRPGGTGPSPEQATMRIDAIKAGLTVFAGGGGAAALFLAARRQWHTERAQAATEHDAAERRVTDLYLKAAEQLGSDKAPVRLAGLHALERLAQDNCRHRQTIVAIICAYLRMPFPKPPATPKPVEPLELKSATSDPNTEERQVRLTAQRILINHLRPDPGNLANYWTKINLDLSHAHLIDFDASQCIISRATFIGALFSGVARFVEAQFPGDAIFDEAQFSEAAEFEGAQFSGLSGFFRVQFSWFADFAGVRFCGNAVFDEVKFSEEAGFNRAQFFEIAEFDGAQFAEDAVFNRAQFHGVARFFGAHFTGVARFEYAQFFGEAGFDDAQFSGAARFSGARFKNRCALEGALTRRGNAAHVWPPDWTVKGRRLEREEPSPTP